MLLENFCDPHRQTRASDRLLINRKNRDYFPVCSAYGCLQMFDTNNRDSAYLVEIGEYYLK
jgi:hypothetical protein